MKTVRKIFLILILLIFACSLFCLGYYFYATKNVTLDPEKLLLNEKNILLYDQNLKQIRNVSDFRIKNTASINEIPLHTQKAFIDTEDKRFFSHSGFDERRIARAFLNNLKAKSFKEGASTISQQLIKNTHLSQEKTVKRKLQEWKLTRQLEKKYSKKQILEKYLNTIYFGHSCFGISSAAEFYFGKNPNELTLAESAILAGLVKSPNNYSPFSNPQNCKRRKETVLTLMQRNGDLSPSDKQSAINEPLPTPSATATHGGFVRHVFDELSEIAAQKSFPVGGKIEIFTYLDPQIQENLESVAQTISDTDKTLLVLDQQTHGFKGCVSTVGNIQRLPGSIIKPLLVYAPAIEENILVPATPILDEKINYNGYSPENYNGIYHGYVSARTCVEKSLNVPAVKTLGALGIDKACTYMQKMRLPVQQEDKSLALALGGMKNGYGLKELLSAYSVFPDGNMHVCGFISAIKINGVPVYKKTQTAQKVFSQETAYLMTDMLKSTAKNGTAKKLRSLPFDIAAKTGTVGTEKGNTDAYAISYTTKDCVGVWLGNANNRQISHTGGGLPCNLLLKINEHLSKRYAENNKKITGFAKPASVVELDLDKPAYYDTHTISLADDFAPQEYRLKELFKNSEIPLYKSTSFSKPTIFPPVLSLENGKAILRFDPHSPSYYEYRIDRYDYVTHTTLYQGSSLPIFIDETVEENKTYQYSVTPIYQGRCGVTVQLPMISTKRETILQDNEMIEKNWWEY